MHDNFPSYALDVSTLPAVGFEKIFHASEDQLGFIAETCGLLGADRFLAVVQFKRWRGDGISVSGNIKSEFIQKCIVSLDPIQQELDVDFETKLVPVGSKLAIAMEMADGEMIMDFDGDDPPDTFEGREVDVWKIIIEHFNLSIDAYPRASSAQLPEPIEELDAKPSSSPFSALGSLKTGKY